MPRFAKAVAATALVASVLSVSLFAVDAGSLHQIKKIVASVTQSAAQEEVKDVYARTVRHSNRTLYVTCRFEKQERWSKRRKSMVERNVKVCS